MEKKTDPRKLDFGTRMLNGAKNIIGKIVGLISTVAIAYYALLTLSSIAIFFLKIALALLFIHALCTHKYFNQFRHHIHELMIAPVKAQAYNAFIRIPMNAVLSAWNAFCSSPEKMTPRKYSETTPSERKIYISIENILVFTINIGVALQNAIADKISHLGNVRLYPLYTAGEFREIAKEGNQGVPGSFMSLGYEFIMGTWNWSSGVGKNLSEMVLRGIVSETKERSSDNEEIAISQDPSLTFSGKKIRS